MRPTARHSQITSLDKFAGPPNIQVAGQPVEGRSGGGLFSADGYVIGVCNAADPSDREGLFAALGSIYAELDRKPIGVRLPVAEREFRRRAGSGAADGIGRRRPAGHAQANARCGRFSHAQFRRRPTALPPPEQAALEEIRRSRKEGSEVIIIIRPRDDPNAKSEIFTLDHASRKFCQASFRRKPAARKAVPRNLAGACIAAEDTAGMVGRDGNVQGGSVVR